MNWLWNKCQNLFKKPHRLSSLLLSMIFVWLLGAMLLIGLSLNVSWRLEERGMTINEAGSLRKQAFYLLKLAETSPVNEEKQAIEYNRFSAILDKLSHFSAHNFNDDERYLEFLSQLATIKASANEILPYLNQNTSHKLPTLAMIERFTDQISILVSIIEADNTSSIILLRWLQAFLIVMAISSAFLTSILLRRLIILPLNRLRVGMENIRQGDFNNHIEITVNNEIGEITTGFNRMSHYLGRMYYDLETLVDEKTEELNIKHANLTFLYNVSSILQNSKDIDYIASHFLDLVMEMSKASGGIIRILNPTKNSTDVIASSGFEAGFLNAPQCNQLNECYCGIALLKQKSIQHQDLSDESTVEALCQKYKLDHLVSFKLSMTDETLGSLSLFFQSRDHFNDENSHIIESASRQLGLILDNLRFEQLDRQMAILEERNLMAQGLHDSIAQSLSFLNIQTQLLTKAIDKDQPHIRDQALTFIKEGVQESYDDVRELLSHFRVTLNRGNFADSIQTVIDRFKRQSNITVNYKFIDQGRELLADAQLQIVFILQEALSNIRKHSKASLVHICIEQQQDRFTLKVQDNGVGFDQETLNQKKSAGHIGSLIMEERADKAHGSLSIVSVINQGTTISLTIDRVDITQ